MVQATDRGARRREAGGVNPHAVAVADTESDDYGVNRSSGAGRTTRRRGDSRPPDEVLGARRQLTVLALIAVVLLLVGIDLAGGVSRRSETGSAQPAASVTAAPAPARSAVAAPPVAAPPTTAAPPKPSPTPAAVVAKPAVPAAGIGTFSVAPGVSPVLGTAGSPLTYQVEVENGLGQNAAAFAAAVDATLGDRRSWIAGRNVRLRRVSDNKPNFRVRLASPTTVDKLCAPLNTAGFTSCRVGDNVVINLARWLSAVPDFKGDLATYRSYAVNHEVGHRLGHGHELCPAPGSPAPVMQQQTLGLKGCVANAWPYPNGTLLSGPRTAGS